MQNRKPELGKYLLWAHFSKNASLRRYLPATRRMTKDSFLELLEKYRMIYVKPSGGSRGVGIFKVTKRGGWVSVKKTTLKERTFKTPTEAFDHINRQREGKPYIVQKGLDLARIHGRPFDIRVMLQRTSPSAPWVISGMVAKIAGKSSVVTNVALSGGTVEEVGPVLKTSFGWKQPAVERCIKEIKRMSLVAANHFDSYQPYRELGMDVAVDSSGKVWLIEENTLPSHALFRKLSSNLSMYRTIQARYGQYSRALHASKRSKSKS